MSKPNFEKCITACNECLAACNQCNNACIDSPRVKEFLRCIMLNRDCALFCNTTALLLQHGSEFLPQVCTLCADACEECAKESARFDLPECQRATEACRHCATECRTALQTVLQLPTESLKPTLN